MIDNKGNFSVKDLRQLPYEDKINVWDKYCNACPFSVIELVRDGKKTRVSSIEEARETILFDRTDKTFILRGCEFNGEYFSLTEIVSNTCHFWYSSKAEIEFEDEEYCEVLNG